MSATLHHPTIKIKTTTLLINDSQNNYTDSERCYAETCFFEMMLRSCECFLSNACGLLPGMVANMVAAKAMTIISFCMLPSLSSKLASWQVMKTFFSLSL
jgi:hypothetical protein